jgi:hypothetical protein
MLLIKGLQGIEWVVLGGHIGGKRRRPLSPIPLSRIAPLVRLRLGPPRARTRRMDVFRSAAVI